ncbi:TonB-dependent outer membrane receptor, SusC/RagA subfamily, signature region [Parapedobacter luteus]|uniref:TonB-dependent outer membrane receptor, SusC/RagA subfamily, signature region n=1 Tax=Parapedobacter luteus TaxID=623280 RepID=A0A1T5A276_9SPHI|nr:TonB-dependent receptor plug domain-containing protein [Parapedobacter luteus]SKB29050.1 TonB-dependent outer membrane receptor, SusC/RagA subfamily, signature region [Parapedobacter luteus]
MTGSREPLIVIDGIPGGSLNLLQQDDIESFDVLKDGSAAAIYGTRGNAGVILITTKKGREGEPRFDYSTYVQREVVDRKPDFLTASDFRNLIAQGIVNADQDFGASTDLYDELIDKQNISHYHNFAASGGSANTNYRVSLFVNDADGIAKQSSRNQWGGRINVNQRGLQDRLNLQVNLAANFSKSNLLGGGFNNSDDPNARITSTGADFEQAVQRNPTAPIYNEDGSFLETQAYNNYNPISRLANRIAERNEQVLSGDAKLTLDIVEGLSASVFGSYVRNSFNDRFYRSTNDWEQRPGTEWQGLCGQVE